MTFEVFRLRSLITYIHLVSQEMFSAIGSLCSKSLLVSEEDQHAKSEAKFLFPNEGSGKIVRERDILLFRLSKFYGKPFSSQFL